MADLPLTIPVHDTIVSAIEALGEHEGLGREESYLLERISRAGAGDAERKAALLQAIEDAPD